MATLVHGEHISSIVSMYIYMSVAGLNVHVHLRVIYTGYNSPHVAILEYNRILLFSTQKISKTE